MILFAKESDQKMFLWKPVRSVHTRIKIPSRSRGGWRGNPIGAVLHLLSAREW